MKPSFALDFRDGVIALHHRTARGWQQVGSTPLDAPDLTEALNYMRSTALGLSPRGVSTKLVIPNEQVLYTQVYAPGPEVAKRRRQIKAGIEGLTPYPLDDLVFDWWGDGPQVQVAIIARETLAEAEAFAAEHRFNPVSFVAVPDDGTYQGEPFFGPSALSATLLAQGEKVERDQDPVSVVAREFPRNEASAEPAAASATDVPVADFAEPKPPVTPQPKAEAPQPAAARPDPAPQPMPAPPVEKAETLPEAPATPAAAVEPNPLPDFRAAVPPPPGAKAFDPKTMAVDLVEEAPMAVDVTDERIEDVVATPQPKAAMPQAARPLDDEIPASPAAEIIAAFASRRAAGGTATGTAAGPAAPAPATTPVTTAAAAKPTVVSDSGKAPSLGPAPGQRPTVPRPSLARPAAAAAPAAARATLPFPSKAAPMNRPAVVGKPFVKPTGPQVTAPGIAGAKRERNVVALPTNPATGSDDSTAKPAAKPASRGQTGLDGRPLPSSSRPRYLGLILTAILLILLALVAAWSQFLTASDQAPDAAPATESTAALTPDALPAADIGGSAVPDALAEDTAAEDTAVDATALTDADPVISEDPQSGDLPTPEEEALSDGQDPALAASDIPADSAADQAAADQVAADQAAADQAAAAQAAVQAAADKAAADQLAAEQAAAAQAVADQAAAEQAAADQAAAAQAAAEEAAAAQTAADQAAADKLAADQAAAAQAAADKAAADKAAADKAAADKLAADQAAAAQAAADKAAADQLALDEAAATQAAADKAAADLAAAEAAKPEPAPETLISTAVANAETPGADPQDEIFLAAADTPPATSDPLSLPQPVSAGDPAPGLAPPPPPFGTVYQFDAEGRIKPTPEGIMTPEGVLLVAGKPKLVPPDRPAALAAVAAPVVETLPTVTATLPAADLGSTAASATEATGATGATAAVEPIISDPALAGKKPMPRPVGLATPTATVKQGDALAPALDSRFADLRPLQRPGGQTPALQTTASAASLAADGLQPVSVSRLALNVSPNPPARPDGLDQAVEAAVAAAVRAPQPETQVAAAEPEAQTEPEAESAAPRLPTSASVAKQATDKHAINTGKVALIGVVSAGSSRIALIRQPGGAIKRLKVGDTVDGGRIAAISASSLQYQKGGRMLTLSMPAS